MTTIYTTTATEFNQWAKLQSSGLKVIQLFNDADIERFNLHKSYYLNSIPNNGHMDFGIGFYKILQMGIVRRSDDSELFYGEACYKANADDEFNPDFKICMYLNQLNYFKSVGRSDRPIEELLGATIEIIGVSHMPPDTRNQKLPRLHYNWRIVEYPPNQENMLDAFPLDDDDLLNAFYGD